jgi:hypothetical protein
VENQDKELPSGDATWLQRLDKLYQASKSDPVKQLELLGEAEMVRYKVCGWYNEAHSGW